MAQQMRWTDDKIQVAVDLVRKLGSVSDTAEMLSKMYGLSISRSAVRHALIASGFTIEQLLDEGRKQAVKDYGPEEEDPETEEIDLNLDDTNPPRAVYEYEVKPEKAVDQTVGLAWQAYTPNASYKPTSFPSAAKSTTAKVQRGIIIPDTHVPLMNKKSWACMLGILDEWKPSFGVIIGDFMEMGSLSKHAKSKPDLVRLSSEYYDTNVALDALQNHSPNCDWTYIEGNHEYRAKRFCSEFGVLDGLLDVPSQLFIQPRPDAYHRAASGSLRGMRWVSVEDQPYINAHSAYYHGHHRTNKFHAAWHAEIYSPSKCSFKPLFYGHMHTFQQFTAENGTYAQCVGFLGDEAGLHYTLGKPTSWSQGVVLQEVSEDGIMSYQVVRIQNGRAVFNGRSVVGNANG